MRVMICPTLVLSKYWKDSFCRWSNMAVRMSVSILVPIMCPMEAIKKLAAASTTRKNRYSTPILITTSTVREARSLMPALVTYRTSMGSTSSHTVVRAAQNRSKNSTHLYFLK